MRLSRLLTAACMILALGACHRALADRPLTPVEHVDLSRYMGRWYVIASIPTFVERDGYDPVETYRMRPDGAIDTSFHFHKGGFDGPLKRIHSVATVVPHTGNAEWQVHLFRVLREQYIVAWLAPDYSAVIVARDARDHAWLMARTPCVADSEYRMMLERLRAMGYDTTKVVKWPQQPCSAVAIPLRPASGR